MTLPKSIPELMAEVAGFIAGHKPAADTTLRFDLGEGGIYRLVIEGGTCRLETGDGAAPVTLRMGAEDGLKLLTGQLGAEVAFFTGRLISEGDRRQLEVLRKLRVFERRPDPAALPAPLVVGQTFNESIPFADQATGRPGRRLTRGGIYNETPTYHFNTAFSADSRYLIFATMRQGRTALIRAEVATGDLTVLAVGDLIDGYDEADPYVTATRGTRYTGNKLALLQGGNWVAASYGKSLCLIHLETLEQRTLIEDVGPEFSLATPTGSSDGRSIIVPRTPEHPAVLRGEPRPLVDANDAFAALGKRPTTYLQVDVETGAISEVFHEPIAGSNHIQVCPTDPNIWLIDRDWPPRFSHGGDYGRTSRAWLLNIRSKALTELRPRNANRFQVHTNWNARGDRIYYHGAAVIDESSPMGMYIGVCDLAGTVLWEYTYPSYFYGHTSTHPQAEAIITDGIVSTNLITALYYEAADAFGAPRVEVLGRHDTEWQGLPGQFPHPHCHMSPDGKWLSYNRAQGKHSDVYVLQLAGQGHQLITR